MALEKRIFWLLRKLTDTEEPLLSINLVNRRLEPLVRSFLKRIISKISELA